MCACSRMCMYACHITCVEVRGQVGVGSPGDWTQVVRFGSSTFTHWAILLGLFSQYIAFSLTTEYHVKERDIGAEEKAQHLGAVATLPED